MHFHLLKVNILLKAREISGHISWAVIKKLLLEDCGVEKTVVYDCGLSKLIN